ncbi:MAG: hypothetical protein ACJ8D3_08285 [Sphingomicrobium sp.]
MRSWIAALTLTLSAPLLAQASAEPSLDQQLTANMARGDLMYAYDQSAWHVTDAALGALPSDASAKLRGYVVTPDAAGYRTTLFGGEQGHYFRIYSAVWTGSDVRNAERFPLDGGASVTGEEARLIEARNVAMADAGELMLCSKSPANTVVIPGATADDPISVYVLTPQTRDGVYPLGGHNRRDVKDGKVVSSRAFTRGCIDFDAAAMMKGSAKGAKPVGMIITHLLDPVPTEIHAFSAHAAHLPIFVGVKSGAMFELGLKDGKATARQIAAK